VSGSVRGACRIRRSGDSLAESNLVGFVIDVGNADASLRNGAIRCMQINLQTGQKELGCGAGRTGQSLAGVGQSGKNGQLTAAVAVNLTSQIPLQGLDQSVDYTGKIEIPTSVGKLSQLGTVDMKIGGTFTSPKVSIDMESLAKKAAAGAVEKAGEKLVGKLLGTDSDASSSDSTSVNLKEEVKKKVVNKALDLFKKK
jgi:hypothetical protein